MAFSWRRWQASPFLRGRSGRLENRVVFRPAIERLETRALPSVQAVSVADPSFIPDTGNGTSTAFASSVSQDGRFVVFSSEASNLVSGQIDAPRGGYYSSAIGGHWISLDPDVFLYDRLAGANRPG